jgi:dolichol-phosphate mannosyltransferase
VVSVVSIIQNDVLICESFVAETLHYLSSRFQYFELLIVDNHSEDGTGARLEALTKTKPSLRVVRLSRQVRREIAFCAGLDHAIGDFVVVLDCRRDPVKMVGQAVEIMLSGRDIVIGQPENSTESALRRLVQIGTTWIVTRVLKVDVISRNGGWRGISRRALNAMTRIQSKGRFIVYDLCAIGYRQESVMYRQELRQGATIVADPMGRELGASMQMLVAHSVTPLRLASLLGLAASGGNLLYLGYVFAVAVFKKKLAEGWLTMSIMTTVMFLILFLILSVLAEYIGRILEESTDSPTYFVEEELSSSVSSYSRDRLNVVAE